MHEIPKGGGEQRSRRKGNLGIGAAVAGTGFKCNLCPSPLWRTSFLCPDEKSRVILPKEVAQGFTPGSISPCGLYSPRRGEAEGTKAWEGFSMDLHSLGKNADSSLGTEGRAGSRTEGSAGRTGE